MLFPRSFFNVSTSFHVAELLNVESPAKMSTVVDGVKASGKSLMNIRNRRGASTDPCGTPCVSSRSGDDTFLTVVNCLREVTYDLTRCRLLSSKS